MFYYFTYRSIIFNFFNIAFNFYIYIYKIENVYGILFKCKFIYYRITEKIIYYCYCLTFFS